MIAVEHGSARGRNPSANNKKTAMQSSSSSFTFVFVCSPLYFHSEFDPVTQNRYKTHKKQRVAS